MVGLKSELSLISPCLELNARTPANEKQFLVKLREFFQAGSFRTWVRAWRSLTKKVGLPGLRFHDLRHPAITELAESGASEQTIMAIAGHVSRRMLERYSHIRMQAKRPALEGLSGHENSYGTIRGTAGDSVPACADLKYCSGNGCAEKKIGGRHRARIATSSQVQNRMVEILRMCTRNISNRGTAIFRSGQIIAV